MKKDGIRENGKNQNREEQKNRQSSQMENDKEGREREYIVTEVWEFVMQ